MGGPPGERSRSLRRKHGIGGLAHLIVTGRSDSELREIRVRYGLLQQPGRRHDRLLRTNPPHFHALGHRHTPPLANRLDDHPRAMKPGGGRA
jgi:hypothetical protein